MRLISFDFGSRWYCDLESADNLWTLLEIGPLHDPVTWYGINYVGTQKTQWNSQNKGTLTCPTRLSYILKVPLCYLRPSIIYCVQCDRIVQRAYYDDMPGVMYRDVNPWYAPHASVGENGQLNWDFPFSALWKCQIWLTIEQGFGHWDLKIFANLEMRKKVVPRVSAGVFPGYAGVLEIGCMIFQKHGLLWPAALGLWC